MNIIEFANRIGVSPTTVSRALSGHGRISETTRHMIQQRMEEFGYVPNPHAQSLVTGRSRMILLHHSDRSVLSDMFLVEMAHGIQQALEREGYGLLLDTAHAGLGVEDSPLVSHWIHSRAVDGVIIKPQRPDRALVEQFADTGIPCVVIGGPSMIGMPRVGAVSVQLDEGVREAAELFIEMGHRRIGFIGTALPDRALEVFRSRLVSAGADLPEDMVRIEGLDPEDGARAMRSLLSTANPPTAVFVRLDTLAVGAIHAAGEMGARVPEDVSVIGYGDIPMAGMLNPPLTTVRVGFFELGMMAMNMLFELINDPDSQGRAEFVGTTLIKRNSVASVLQRD